MTREAAPLKYFRSHLTAHSRVGTARLARTAQAFFVRENVKHSHARDLWSVLNLGLDDDLGPRTRLRFSSTVNRSLSAAP